MKNRSNNEREIDKRMFNVMRTDASKLRGLYENSANGGSSAHNMEPSNADVAEEQNQFRQNIASDTKFYEFSILPDAGNVVFRGEIPNVCEFMFELSERDGFSFKAENPITFSANTLSLLTKLHGYFENWKEEWGLKLSEYQNNAK